MDIKKLEKAAKVFELLKVLDLEIIELDRVAMLVADGEVNISLSLDVADLAKNREDSERVSFDEDGSMKTGITQHEKLSWMYQYSILGGFGSRSSDQSKPAENITSLKKTVSENTALQVLEALLYEKNQQRLGLINRLHSLGVVI